MGSLLSCCDDCYATDNFFTDIKSKSNEDNVKITRQNNEVGKKYREKKGVTFRVEEYPYPTQSKGKKRPSYLH
jgi:hypothetical protein